MRKGGRPANMKEYWSVLSIPKLRSEFVCSARSDGKGSSLQTVERTDSKTMLKDGAGQFQTRANIYEQSVLMQFQAWPDNYAKSKLIDPVSNGPTYFKTRQYRFKLAHILVTKVMRNQSCQCGFKLAQILRTNTSLKTQRQGDPHTYEHTQFVKTVSNCSSQE